MTRPMTDIQRAVWSRPINPSKRDSDQLDKNRSRAERVRLELRESINESLSRRYRMERVKS